MLANLGANDAQTAGDTCCTTADVGFAGDIVKMDPLTIAGGYDALCTQDHTVGFAVKGGQNGLDLVFRELLGGFRSPAGEDFVCVMIMMMVRYVGTLGNYSNL